MAETRHIFTAAQAEDHDFAGRVCWCVPVLVEGGAEDLVIHQTRVSC